MMHDERKANPDVVLTCESSLAHGAVEHSGGNTGSSSSGQVPCTIATLR